MPPEVIAGLAEGAIPLAGGVYGTLIGYRVVGKRPGESAKYDQWYTRFGVHFKWMGPVLIAYGLFQMIRAAAG
jgi:hypothetical protein